MTINYTFNYTLSKSTCLDFFKNYLMKTKHFKNIFLKYLFVLIALIILFYLVTFPTVKIVIIISTTSGNESDVAPPVAIIDAIWGSANISDKTHAKIKI